jgi:hypothetical protein
MFKLIFIIHGLAITEVRSQGNSLAMTWGDMKAE